PSALSQQDDQTPAELYASAYTIAYEKKVTSMPPDSPTEAVSPLPLPQSSTLSTSIEDAWINAIGLSTDDEWFNEYSLPFSPNSTPSALTTNQLFDTLLSSIDELPSDTPPPYPGSSPIGMSLADELLQNFDESFEEVIETGKTITQQSKPAAAAQEAPTALEGIQIR
ncbi:MAG TPA: hypothetical protein PLV25_06565, partial [Opitutales bacterium]|nr:hypothetical protein [Opitutales bacterium]